MVNSYIKPFVHMSISVCANCISCFLLTWMFAQQRSYSQHCINTFLGEFAQFSMWTMSLFFACNVVDCSRHPPFLLLKRLKGWMIESTLTIFQRRILMKHKRKAVALFLIDFWVASEASAPDNLYSCLLIIQKAQTAQTAMWIFRYYIPSSDCSNCFLTAHSQDISF